MIKTQQLMIDKAKRGGFRAEQIEELQREDLTINQLNHMFRFFCSVNCWKKRHTLDFSNLEPELISAVKDKKWEHMHKIFDSAYEQLKNLLPQWVRFSQSLKAYPRHPVCLKTM